MYNVLVRLADINVEFNTRYYKVPSFCRNYVITNAEPDLIIKVTQEQIDKEESITPVENRTYPSYYELSCAYRNLCYELWKYDAFILHSASFTVDGRGIAFAAKSGTGKTTHLRLWQNLLGDKLKIVNGDKPIVRFIDDKPYIYGTPWCGKEGLGNNIKAPLTDICFIERDKTNSVVKMNKEEALNRIFSQILLPSDSMGSIKTLDLIDRILNTCNLWLIRCNKDIEAAKVAYTSIIQNGEDKL